MLAAPATSQHPCLLEDMLWPRPPKVLAWHWSGNRLRATKGPSDWQGVMENRGSVAILKKSRKDPYSAGNILDPRWDE